MGEIEDLLDLARDQQDADTGFGGASQAVGHVLDGTDVEPTRRLRRDQHRRLAADSSRASTTRC